MKKKPAPKAALSKKTEVKDEEPPGEIPGLIGAGQPLLYIGPPPAIRQLYKKSGYDKNFHPQNLLEHMRAGKSRSEIVAFWGITYSRFNEWLDAYPEMAEAYSIGKPAFDAYYKQALRDSSFGVARTVRENSLFFMLKNQAGFDEGGGGHEYADAQVAELEFVDEKD